MIDFVVFLTMMKTWNNTCVNVLCCILLAVSHVIAVRHARNLIWTQTPSLKLGVSKIVGIEGDPTVWVPSGNVQVRHISAPHTGWQFKSLAFHYANQMLYWTEATHKKVQALRLNGTTETETIFTGTSSMAEGLAVDWISNNIYWTDSLYNWIMMAPLAVREPSCKIIARTQLSNPHGIAVYPEKGYLVWTDIGVMSKIEISDLLGDNRITIVDTNILHPRGIAIDYTEETLYWVDSKKDTVESSDFNGNNRRTVIYQADTMFYGIALNQKYLFVTEQSQGHLRVYDKKAGTNEINYQLGYIPDGIVMYDESVQLGNSSACDQKGCQQICVNHPLTGPICRCGEGYILQPNGISCVVNSKFGVPSHFYAIGDAICNYPINLPDMSLINVSLESQCFLRNVRGYFGLTFDAHENMLYYSENVTKSIGRIYLDFGETGDTIIKGVGEVQAIALDWIAGNLYWTDQTYGHISMAKKDGMYPLVVLENLDKPLGIAVHPERGEIYWTEQGKTRKIYKASMDGSHVSALVNQSAVGMPNHIFVDYASSRLYWADSMLYAIRTVDLDTLEVYTIYGNVPQMVTFFGISLYQDYILWTDKNDTKNGIHAARLDKMEKVRGILHPQAGIASSLITFDIHSQPDMNSACEQEYNRCEHICRPTSNSTFICACGVGYTLEEDLHTCSSSIKTDNFVVVVDSYLKQLYQIEVDSGEVSAIQLSETYKGIAVDINPFTNTLYLTDNKAGVILAASFDSTHEVVFRKLPNDSTADGLAVDYYNQLLFYTCTEYNIIVVVSLRNPELFKTIVNESLDEPRDIVVHPDKGTIFWTDWGKESKIEKATMDGGNRSVVVQLHNESWPNALALDVNSMNLFWADAKNDNIGRINLDTGVKKIIYSEPKTHFFGLSLMGGYLYVTDWFRKHLSRMSLDGGTLVPVGPHKFSRLNGIASYKKSEIRAVFGKCLQSTCSNLCLPVSEMDYICACADEGKLSTKPCTELNEVYSPESTESGSLKKAKESSPAMTIGMSVLGIVAVLVIAVGAIYIYNKRVPGAEIPHDKLVEDTSRIDSYYKIAFPEPIQEEANCDSGIENPSFRCSVEDIQHSGNIVRYSPM